MPESEARQRWRRSAYKLLEKRYKRLLFRTPASNSLKFHLSRAYFHQGRYSDALAVLDELCAAAGASSKYWHLQSRCYSCLHQQTGDSVYLEKAFNGLKVREGAAAIVARKSNSVLISIVMCADGDPDNSAVDGDRVPAAATAA